MSTTTTTTNDSGVHLPIPVGFATKLGSAGTALLTLATLLTTLLDGNHFGETKVFATLSVVIASVTIIGRMLQAAAAIIADKKVTIPGGSVR